MKLYHYNRVTNEYTGEKEARESPLEPGVFLHPANTTEIVPPPVGANQVAIFENGAWVVKPDYRGETWYQADRTPVEIDFIGDPSPLVRDEPPKSQEELDAEHNAIVDQVLREIDISSVRAIREWLVAQPDAPQFIIDYEAAAVAKRGERR